MKNISVKTVMTIVLVYLAAIIGAGFATGTEIIEFFLIYGKKSILGLVVMGILLFVIGFFVMEKVRREKIKSVNAYLKSLLGNNGGQICHVFITTFLFFVYAIMIAGGSEILCRFTSLSSVWSGCLLSFLCLLIFLNDGTWFINVNKFLAPFIILGIVISCILVIYNRGSQTVMASMTNGNFPNKWFFSAAIYVSYNSLLSIIVLTELGKQTKSIGETWISALTSSVLVVIIGGAIIAVLAIYYGKIELMPMPMIVIMSRLGQNYELIYGIVLFLAILTTAVSNAYGVIEYCQTKTKLQPLISKLLIVIGGFMVSQLGFNWMIKYVYGGFGTLGLFLILMIFVKEIKFIIVVKIKNMKYLKNRR